MVILLPFPPAVSAFERYRIGHGGKKVRYLDRRYETWKRAADNLAKIALSRPRMKGPVSLVITIDEKHRDGSIDARAATVRDWLTRSGMIAPGVAIDSVTTRWGNAPEGARVLIGVVERIAA